MKVYKNKNMPVWSDAGTHYSQKVTLTEKEAKELKINFPIGTHYCHLDILDYFSGEPFRKHKMWYDNTFVVVIPDKKEEG